MPSVGRAFAPGAALVALAMASACGSSATSSTAGAAAGVAAASPPASPAAASSSSTASNSSHFTVSGTVRGAAVEGSTPAVPQCQDVMAGEIVTWSGNDKAGGQLAGEFDLPSGSGTLQFGGGGSLMADLVVGGDYSNRLPATSGTVNVAGDHQSGSIDATFSYGSDSVHLSGSWVCP